MKICKSCGFENIDEAKFCKNCGEKLTDKTGDVRPVDNADIIVKDTNNNLITKLFYKNDKYTGKLRIAKTKIITIAVFFIFFLFEIVTFATGNSFVVVFIAAVIFGLIFAIPTFIIGWIVGKVIDRLNH